MTIAEGTKIGRYEIRSLIGAGGMGEVYLADDNQLGRKVAIKFLPEKLITDDQAKKRLVRATTISGSPAQHELPTIAI
jgi:serine/threonine protein kinase